MWEPIPRPQHLPSLGSPRGGRGSAAQHMPTASQSTGQRAEVDQDVSPEPQQARGRLWGHDPPPLHMRKPRTGLVKDPIRVIPSKMAEPGLRPSSPCSQARLHPMGPRVRLPGAMSQLYLV